MPAFAPPFSDRVAHTWTATQTFDPADNTPAISVSGVSLTGSSAVSAFELSATWNTSGTPTALDVNITDTTSNSASNLANLRVGGVSKFRFQKDGQLIATTAVIVPIIRSRSNSGEISLGASDDIKLIRDAANVLAQRTTTSAQTFRIYNTFTSSTNYERLGINWASNVCTITTEAQTGTVRPLVFKSPAVTLATLPAASTAGAGARSVISDATTPSFGATAVGGGSTVSPVYSDGTNWIVG